MAYSVCCTLQRRTKAGPHTYAHITVNGSVAISVYRSQRGLIRANLRDDRSDSPPLIILEKQLLYMNPSVFPNVQFILLPRTKTHKLHNMQTVWLNLTLLPAAGFMGLICYKVAKLDHFNKSVSIVLPNFQSFSLCHHPRTATR